MRDYAPTHVFLLLGGRGGGRGVTSVSIQTQRPFVPYWISRHLSPTCYKSSLERYCHRRICLRIISLYLWVNMVGWLVGWFWVYRPFETVFQSISGRLPKRGRKRKERIDESKNVQTTPTRTYCKRIRPLPYCNPNCRTPRHWKFAQHHRTTRPPHNMVGPGRVAQSVGHLTRMSEVLGSIPGLATYFRLSFR